MMVNDGLIMYNLYLIRYLKKANKNEKKTKWRMQLRFIWKTNEEKINK